MQEMMVSRMKSVGVPMLYFDAADYPLGKVADVNDRIGRRWYQNNAANQPSIVNDATMGNVLQLVSTSQLVTPLAGIDMTGSWKLEAVFRATEVASSGFFSTGDYNNGRILGMNVGVNGNADYVQMFVDNGSYTMLHPKGSWTGAWEKLVITRRKGVSYTLELIRNGISLGPVITADFAPGPGGTLATIGVTVASSRSMGGFLKSIRVDKL